MTESRSGFDVHCAARCSVVHSGRPAAWVAGVCLQPSTQNKWGFLEENPVVMTNFNQPMRSTGEPPDVDAVITWVDGSESSYAEKLSTHLDGIIGEGTHVTRFANCGEIEYCVVSILKFAPWIRKIFIVTDQQTPKFISSISKSLYAPKIQLIDHKEIFRNYESCLPTFNNRSIETVIWRIPNISENFIYFNDDFILVRPVSRSDFFREGKVVLRGTWRPIYKKFKPKNILKNALSFFLGKNTQPRLDMHTAGQQLSAVKAGLSAKYLRLAHNPYPCRRSTIELFFSKKNGLFERNISYKFRSSKQILCQHLASYLEIKNGNAIIDNSLSTLILRARDRPLSSVERKLEVADQAHSVAFACIQSMDQADPEIRDAIFSWLNARVGRMADFSAQSSVLFQK